MLQQLYFQFLRPIVKFVIIVPVHLHSERTRILTHTITKSLILQPIDTPISTTQLKSLTYHISFQRIREPAFLVFFGEIDMDRCTTGTLYGRLKLFDFLKSTQIGFHPFYQCIHLLKRAPIR